MSFSISPISAVHSQFDPTPAPKPVPQPTEEQQIAQLALQGNTPTQIATAVGLPESLVEVELGATTSSTTSAVSQASALLSLGARLSVEA